MTENALNLEAILHKAKNAVLVREPIEGELVYDFWEALALWESARDVRPLLAEVLRLRAGLQMIADNKHLVLCPKVDTPQAACGCHSWLAKDTLDGRLFDTEDDPVS